MTSSGGPDGPPPARPRPARAPRISDVAAAAGVSTATVSRALSFPDKLREDTRTRVLAAVGQLGYTPNLSARNLRIGSSRTVLVVVPGRSNPPFFSEVLHGIDAELSAAGYALVMGTLDGSAAKARRVLDLALARHLDGVLVISGRLPAPEGRSIADAGLPLVSIGAELDIPHASAVLIDDAACARAQARHLIDLGHRRLMYVAGPENNYNETIRYRGFRAAVREAGLPEEAIDRQPGDYMFSGGIAAARAFLGMSRRPTGVACCNDEMAIGFMKTVTQAGVKIPGEVSVVGFDGIEFADFCEPTLTTIRQPRFELGATGARVLLGKLRPEAAATRRRIVLRADLVVRDSTGLAPP